MDRSFVVWILNFILEIFKEWIEFSLILLELNFLKNLLNCFNEIFLGFFVYLLVYFICNVFGFFSENL